MGLSPTQGATADIPAARYSWPFQAAPHTHDIQVSEHGVGVPCRQEVQFRDGHRIWLRRVMRQGAPCTFLRELGEPAEGVLFDLRQLVPDAQTELPLTSTRDVAGYVQLSLRLRFATRDAFLEAVMQLERPE